MKLISENKSHFIINLLGIKLKLRKRNVEPDAGVVIPTYSEYERLIDRQNNRDYLNLKILDSRPVTFNFVTDTISRPSLLGGVGTALILASKYCVQNKLPLRIIVRSTDIKIDEYIDFMNLLNEEIPEQVSLYTDYNRKIDDGFAKALEINKGDMFLATSWWSACALKKSNINNFFYIVQEVETFFYNYGDNHLLCSEIMNDPNICFIVNSKWLWEYFNEKFPNITKHGIYFNPCFPKFLYNKKIENIKINERKRKLFFYGRIANSRNLYYTGLKLLNNAIMNNIIDTDKWDIYFAGSTCEPVMFDNGYTPKFMGQLSWAEYSIFLRDIDLCVSLMYAPHPSYPPLDAAQSGCVVVTNKFSNKIGCEWSKNIIFASLDSDDLLKALQDGVNIVDNPELRADNFLNSTIPDDWDVELKEVITFMQNYKFPESMGKITDVRMLTCLDQIITLNLKSKYNHAVIFAMYDKNGIIRQNVIDYLKELRKYSDFIILVADNEIDIRQPEKVENLVDYIYCKRHGEYDFGSYKIGFNILKRQNIFDKTTHITFCNDSVQYSGKSLSGYFNMYRDYDTFGLTKNLYAFRLIPCKYPMHRAPHIQSYFITLSDKIFKTKWFDEFINSVKKEEHKYSVCIKYEVELSRKIIKHGFRINSYYPPVDTVVDPAGYYCNNNSPFTGERLFTKKSKDYPFAKFDPANLKGCSFKEKLIDFVNRHI